MAFDNPDSASPGPGWTWDPDAGRWMPPSNGTGNPYTTAPSAPPDTRDPYGHLPGDPSYGYPTGTNPYWDKPGGMANAPKTNPENPQPTPPPTSPTPNTYSGSGFSSPDFTWPEFHAPTLPSITPFSFEAYRAPDPFTYDKFTAPTMADAQNEPGYQFGVEQGLGALKAALSARGVYRTGAAPKEFFTWANRAAEQNYGNVFNRSANSYTLNRNNAFENWGANESARAQAYDRNYADAKSTYDTNTGNTFGLYDRDLQGKLDEFNPKFQSAQLTFDDMYRRWKAGLDASTAIATAGAGL